MFLFVLVLSVYGGMLSKAQAAVLPTKGDTIYFGRYFIPTLQYVGLNKGYVLQFRPIAWRVLESKNGEVFLESKEDVLQRRAMGGYSWESSELRSWLDSSFIMDAFSTEERALIKNASVPNQTPSPYSPGQATMDRVFVLSIYERVSFGGEKDLYWTRTKSGSSTFYTSFLSGTLGGSFSATTANGISDMYAVRPALKLDLSALQATPVVTSYWAGPTIHILGSLLPDGFYMSSGDALTIPEGVTLSIPPGKVLTVGANSTIENNGVINNGGTISNSPNFQGQCNFENVPAFTLIRYTSYSVKVPLA
jgi:hypothetical protein